MVYSYHHFACEYHLNFIVVAEICSIAVMKYLDVFVNCFYCSFNDDCYLILIICPSYAKM